VRSIISGVKSIEQKKYDEEEFKDAEKLIEEELLSTGKVKFDGANLIFGNLSFYFRLLGHLTGFI
jgi:hypothetical protein